MKKIILSIVTLSLLFCSCENEEDPIVFKQGDYPVKEYYLERDPKVNPWGAGMDFVNSECKLAETELDYAYMTDSCDFTYDIKFYIVKSYYYLENGDLANEGCPAMLLSAETKASQVGVGLSFFDSLTIVTNEMLGQLAYDPVIDYSIYKDETTGFYERETLFAALDACIIGRDFRSGVLEVPEDKKEEDVQPVYLVKTVEGAYVKFMVKQYKPAKPNEKQTLVRWQVISE